MVDRSICAEEKINGKEDAWSLLKHEDAHQNELVFVIQRRQIGRVERDTALAEDIELFALLGDFGLDAQDFGVGVCVCRLGLERIDFCNGRRTVLATHTKQYGRKWRKQCTRRKKVKKHIPL